MKRRVISLITALALSLSLCPASAWAEDWESDDTLCPHHQAHTEECGYTPSQPGQPCTHEPDESCYVTETRCVHEHDETCYPAPETDGEPVAEPDAEEISEAAPEPSLCSHVCTEESGCVTRTLDCHHVHDEACGYVEDVPGTPCRFVCRICPVQALIDELPGSVTADNREQVQALLAEIMELYSALEPDEQAWLDVTPCEDLQAQLDASNRPMLAEDSSTWDDVMYDDFTEGTTTITQPRRKNMNGHNISVSGKNPAIPAILITGTGSLSFLNAGTVQSMWDAGIVIQSGGSLTVDDAGLTVDGYTCALDIADGAHVTLSAGKYIGWKGPAISAPEDFDFSSLLAEGCAFFKENEGALSPEEAKTATTLTVGTCTNHLYKYAPDAGEPTHSATCPYCGEKSTLPCEFTFDAAGTGACSCGNEITITVDEDELQNLAYNGSIKPEGTDIVTVTLKDTTELTQDTDYTVSYSTSTEAVGTNGIVVTVTVEGVAYGGTFSKEYHFTPQAPALKWVPNDSLTVTYTGEQVVLNGRNVIIQGITDADPTQIQYSYKGQNDSDYQDGLPINAGEYNVVATLPEQPGGHAAVSSEPLSVTIEKLYPIEKAPEATQPEYNKKSQELVTVGALKPAAAADGAKILFATSAGGPFTETIPTGINAKEYDVWFMVEETGNCESVAATKVPGVKIQRKQIEPKVELEYYTTLYDNGYKEPKVTVKDPDDQETLLDTEYQVAYADNQNVGTATVTVTDKPGGNYAITQVEENFQITSKIQDTLSITNKPNTVTYGDTFTLGTVGGSGNGNVTWKITSGTNVAEVDQNSGEVTIIGDGTAVVEATKSGTYGGVANYEDAKAAWTIVARKKPVVATVTAEDKTYDGNDTAIVHAEVKEGVLAGDEIKITGLTGTFSDANAGKDKTVTLNSTNLSVTGNHSGHYAITYSSTTTVTADIFKAVPSIATVPVADTTLVYNKTPQTLLTSDATVQAGTPAQIVNIPVEYALSEDGPYNASWPTATNAGAYEVWYRVQETQNYTGIAAAMVPAAIARKPVAPTIELSGNDLRTDKATTPPTYYYIYDGSAKEPAVALYEADGTTLIPADEYAVSYSNNTNVDPTPATVTITAKADGNYAFTPDPVEAHFEIRKEQAKVITAPKPAAVPLTYNTFPQELVIAGTGSGGTMVYSVGDQNGPYSADIPTMDKADVYKVYYKVEGDGNHSDSHTAGTEPYVEVTIGPKVVNDRDLTIELKDGNGAPLVSYTYDSTPKTPGVVVKDGSTVIGAGEYNVIYRDNVNAGKATVEITDVVGGNYTVTGSTTFTILKADIEFVKEPEDAGATYNGSPQELLAACEFTGGTILYALGSPTSNYGDAIPTGINAGNYTVYYKVVGDNNHNDVAITKVPAAIKSKPLTKIDIELTPNSFEYDGGVKMPGITVKDGKTVLPEEEYTVTCTAADGTETTSPANEGPYTITIGDVADGNYDLSGVTANTATFTIGQTKQEALEIDHSSVTTTNYGDTFTLAANGGSGTGTVTWTATGPVDIDPATGAVEITGVGEVTIIATNPGDQNYLPISGQWTFTAAPKPVTAAITVANKVYDGTTDATVASAGIDIDDLETGDTVTITPGSIIAAFTDPAVGSAKTVTLDTSKVVVAGDTEKYDISYPSTTVADITIAAASITTAPKEITPLTYDRTAQALVTAGKTNVGFLVYSLDGKNFSPEIPTGTDAGTYTIYYKVDGNANYTGVPANTSPLEVTIAPKPVEKLKIELVEPSYVYDGRKHEPAITVRDDKTVIDSEQYTVIWDDPGLTAAKTYTATIASEAGGNYTFSGTATLKIVEAAQDALHITGQPDNVYYGDEITTLKTTGGSGNGRMEWSIESGGANSIIDPASGKLTIKDTGSITVKAKRIVDNYGTVEDTWTFTAEAKPVTAVVTIKPKPYDGTNTIDDADITAAVDHSDLVDPADSFTIIGLKATYDDANAGTGKTVAVDSTAAATTADNTKYAVSYPATTTADIAPREVTVSVTLSDHDLQTDDTTGAYYYAYDGTEKKPSVTVVGTATDDPGYTETLTPNDYTVAYANNKNVGTTAEVAVGAKAGGNFTFPDEPVSFEIRDAKAEVTTDPQAKNRTYDGTTQDLVTAGVATGGEIWYSTSGGAGTYGPTIPQATNAGIYTVYYMVKGDANHKDTAPSSVSVEIKAKEITPEITVTPATYTYDGNPQRPAVKVADNGVDIPELNGVPEYTVSYQDNIDAGTAKVIISNNNGGNYIVNGSADFVIEKAPPIVTPPAGKTGLQYNGSAQELVTAGVTGDGTVLYSVNGGNYSAAVPTATAVYTYEVSWKVQGDKNHNDTTPRTLTVKIDKNTVTNPTISLSSETFKYNGSQQKPAVTVYDKSGRPIPEHEYTIKIEGTNGNTGMIDVDTYTVTVTATANSNYDIQGNNTRTFEIVAANQETISITNTRTQVFYGDVIHLGTTNGPGGSAVTWTVTDAADNPLDWITQGGLLTVKDVGGTIKVTVTRTAANYGDVSATWEFTPGRKPVTAVVTADDRNYIAGNSSATVHAVIPDGDLVFGDKVTINDLPGIFDNPNVGTGKKVTVDSSNPTVNGAKAANYDITYPATTTASILAEAAAISGSPLPKDLTYDAAQAQELVDVSGVAVTGGIMVYSLDGKTFTPSIPKAKDAGAYTVYYKAQGDGNHTDSAICATPVSVTIKQQEVTPSIELSPPSAQYDGNVKHPEVTVRDSANNVIPANEYKVTYVNDNGENWMKPDTYTVKIENISGGNYVVKTASEPFTISATAQNPLEIVNKPGIVHYGDTFTLSATGGSGSEKVTWSVDSAGASVVEIDNNGFVKIIGVGQATITATRPGGDNYEDATAAYPLNALPKPITAIVTAEDKVYDGGVPATTKLHVTWKDGDLVGNDEIKTTGQTGTFKDENVGTNKTVTVKVDLVSDTTSQKYDITIPATTTASILKADAADPAVTPNTLTYTGSAQDLVSGGDANTLYSDARDGVYSTTVPTGTNAGTYTVWYKGKGDANHNDSAPQPAQVTIRQKTLSWDDTNVKITLSGNDLQGDAANGYFYDYDGTDKEPAVTISDGAKAIPASEYNVTYSNNKNVSQTGSPATATVTSTEGGNYTFDAKTVNFEIKSAGAKLTKSPEAKDLTYTGAAQELVTVGTADGGHIEYSLDGTNYGKGIPTGTGAGTYTVHYKVVGDSNHASDGPSGSVSVTIKPKEVVSPVVTVTGTYTYDGNAKEPDKTNSLTVVDGGKTIPDTEYTVTYRDNINAGTATVVITNKNGGDYIVNGTGTFTIGQAAAAVGKDPAGKTNLQYNGTAQELVTPGEATNGTLVYSVDGGEYSPVIPTGTAVGNYTVSYKVLGDSNHSDTAPVTLAQVTIGKNNVTAPTIQVTPESVTFDGKKHGPAVTIKDDKGILIDGSEYTVSYEDEDGNPVAAADLVNPGTYTLVISASGSNYEFNIAADVSPATFTILPADQTPLVITNTRDNVFYGDKIQLNTTGGNGSVTWEVDGDNVAAIGNNTGLLTITGVGSGTVTATSTAAGYAPQTAIWLFYADAKQVTVVLTGGDRAYKANDVTTTLTATMPANALVGNDDVAIADVTGKFADANVGTDKKVTVDNLKPTVTGADAAKYNITCPATTTASIFKADIDTTDTTKVTLPTVATGLVYTGLPQALVTGGSAEEGTLEYSLDNITYSAALTATNAGDYDVWYRVKGDSNHNDSAVVKLTETQKATIDQQQVDDPTIEFTPSSVSYDGSVHKPSVTVKDNHGRVIPDSEYTVVYSSATDWTKAGDHTVTVKATTDGNYAFAEKTEAFTINPLGQTPLTILNQPGKVQYGDSFTLVASGGSGNGDVKWVSDRTDIATVEQNGLVKVWKSGGPVKITVTKEADDNHPETSATWTFSAEKKPVTPIVTAEDKEYDGVSPATTTLHFAWKDGDLVGNDTIDTTPLVGTFDNPNAGQNKTVTITGTISSDKYDIKIPAATTASITPATATVTGVTPKGPLTYTGQAQDLVTEGSVTGGGNVEYSLDGGATYSLNAPKATNAGTYTVWYKAAGGGNYADSVAKSVKVTIEPRKVDLPVIELSSGTFDYDGTAKKPDVVVKDGSITIPASEYTVGYSNNVQAGTATVTVSDAPGGNYEVKTATANFTIQAGAMEYIVEPQPKTVTYNGFAQALLTAGSAKNGTVVYSETEDGEYTTSIPRGTDADAYQVWYRIKDADGNFTEPRDAIAVIEPKQVTPIITLASGSTSFPYDGTAQEPGVTVSVSGTTIDSSMYMVTYSNNTNPGTATITVQSVGGNYQFTATKTFEIVKTKATFLTPPAAIPRLVYNGTAQKLVKPGVAGTGGIVLYSLDGTTYSAQIPTGTDVDDYVVYAKIQGTDEYLDSAVIPIKASIEKNEVQHLLVELSATSFTYNGTSQKPTITLTDDDGNVISPSEYKVTYVGSTITVGNYTVKISSREKNYIFAEGEQEYLITILDANQTPLAITGKPDKVYYGDTLSLGATGGSGAVAWSVESGNANALGSGQFEVKGSGSITIKAESGGASDTWTFYAYPKPVTAIVTAADKPFDTNPTVKLTVTVSGSDLAFSDAAFTLPAEGHFADANVGANKTVFIDSVEISDEIKTKYDISYPATTTASITAAEATVTSGPTAQSLTYTGLPQALVSGGVAEHGTIAYSTDGTNYTLNVPTGTDAKTYTFWYKALGDENYKDSKATQMSVTIGPNIDAPKAVVCSPSELAYDGTEKTPTVTVLDNSGREIPQSEYTVELPSPRSAVKTYTVTVTDKPGGNYEFTGPVNGTFEIVATSQNPLSIVTDIPTNIHYGDTFRLSATGGSGSGAIKWTSKNETIATITDDGSVKVSGVGGFTIEAYREAAGGYNQSNTATVSFFADPKPVTPVVTAEDKPYDGTTDAKLTAAFKTGDLVGEDTITLTVGDGTFDNANAGTNKKVTIPQGSPFGTTSDGKYIITWPDSTTATINKVDATIANKPTANPGSGPEGLVYTGGDLQLVNPGSTVNNIGKIVYSLDQNGEYSEDVPTAINAGDYKVWYKVADSINYTGVPAASIPVMIQKAKPNITTYPTASGSITEGQPLSGLTLSGGANIGGTFTWVNGNTTPPVGTSTQKGIFTPDNANYETITFDITVTVNAPSESNGTGTNDAANATAPSRASAKAPARVSAPLQTTVANGTATTVVNASAASALVAEAAANQGQNVVIRPEVPEGVSRTEVSIPASTVSQIRSGTSAGLTVSTPIADVAIPSAALNTLSHAGGTIQVVAEQTADGIAVSLAADGKSITQVPGGLTVTLPAAEAGPGTVAVLVHGDGTTETIRKAVPADGTISVQLDGPAVVKVVDNSKSFTDVPADSWAADAVAFASAHELLNGTSEGAFSPDQAMSRAMLTAVLYNLEGNPAQAGGSTFSDVSSDAWYADSVAWAAANGIANGYGDGQFGPDKDVTREQFAVMLWKYAGSPAAEGQDLGFADADQASGYALDALRWAAANGILNGKGSGRLDPGGLVTRAQVAQMLKNFMENT